jgi:L-fuculose-phosphate aldolase
MTGTWREDLIAACRALASQGLSYGTSGNVSVRRDSDSFYVSPTGMNYDELTPRHVPLVKLDGTWSGERRPSSEWRFHRDIYQARPEAGAVVHTHSRYATALATAGKSIPAFHYMVAVAGGADIRCAPYATFGTQELSDHAVTALQGRKACLLANHGVIALGTTLAEALKLAGEVENLAGQYTAALQVGPPAILDDTEMKRVLALFAAYGKQNAEDPDLRHIPG